jgi:threonine synthase
MEFLLRCRSCGAEWPADSMMMLCDRCPAEDRRPPEGILEVIMHPSAADRRGAGTDWRANGCLPADPAMFPPVPMPDTPVWTVPRLRERYAKRRLFVKFEASLPSGSLKDRASFLVAAQARSNGIGEIALASTGNAGSSMACIGAAAGIPVRLFLPAAAPQGKIVQAAQYGAILTLVDGSYDDAFAASLEYIAASGALSRNTGYNPFTTEGKKTVSFEIASQIGIPDRVFVSAGDGVILCGLYKGFEDLIALGLADRIPKITAVQAAGSSAIYRAWKGGGFDAPEPCDTLADSISVEVPQAGHLALDKLKAHGGEVVIVDDGEILAAQKELSDGAGIFSEPSAAAAWAGWAKRREQIGEDELVLVLVTGSGLKDVASAARGLESEHTIGKGGRR